MFTIIHLITLLIISTHKFVKMFDWVKGDKQKEELVKNIYKLNLILCAIIPIVSLNVLMSWFAVGNQFDYQFFETQWIFSRNSFHYTSLIALLILPSIAMFYLQRILYKDYM